jgi:bacillithiol system protein YtxJ
MSFFSGLRGMMGGDKSGLSENWRIPEDETEIDGLLGEGCHVIYKHSFSCGTCMFAKIQVEDVMSEYSGEAQFYFVEVRQNRSISNYIAQKTGVRHESPQILVIKNGDVLMHASHTAVQKSEILETLNKNA